MNEESPTGKGVRVLPGGKIEVVGYNPMQTLFLERLARLVRLEEETRPLEDREMNEMIRRAIYSTLRDCQALGVLPEARRLLKEP